MVDMAAGRPAQTDWAVIGRDQVSSRVVLTPLTGRSHQLRVHMLALGHPILGDPKYNTAASRSLSEGLKLQLHARRLILPHPAGGTLTLEAPISPELKAGFERFGFDPHEADPEPFKRCR